MSKLAARLVVGALAAWVWVAIGDSLEAQPCGSVALGTAIVVTLAFTCLDLVEYYLERRNSGA